MSTEAIRPGVGLAWLERLELVTVVTPTGRVYQALRAVFSNEDGQRAELITSDHPNAVRGLLTELGHRDASRPLTPDGLNSLCGRFFNVRTIWIHEGGREPTVIVAGLKAVQRIQA